MPRKTAERLLYLLKSRGPLDAGDAARLLGISTAGAQQQFAALAREALVEASDRAIGRGRPRRFWQLTGRGHARFPDRHGDLTVDLLDAARAVFGDAGIERLVAHREAASLAAGHQRLVGADTLVERLDRLVAMRSEEGYMAQWTESGDGDYLLVENHCPVCAAASQCQGLCRSELAQFRAWLAPLATVERVEHLLGGGRRCSYRVTPRTAG